MEQAQAITTKRVQTDVGHTLEMPVDLSVVVPISERYDDLRQLYNEYSDQISEHGYSREFIFVLDGVDLHALQTLKELRKDHSEVKVVTLNRWAGEATALSVGLEKARGSIILTLPSYFQVDPTEIGHMLTNLIDGKSDLVIGWRYPRIDSRFNRLQSRVFHALTRALTGLSYHDVSCGVRAMTRKVAEEVQLYGDLHRFFPLLAHQRGFKVAELPVHQSKSDAKRRLYSPGVYLRRLLDLLTLFFLYKFTKKTPQVFWPDWIISLIHRSDNHSLPGGLPATGIRWDRRPSTSYPGCLTFGLRGSAFFYWPSGRNHYFFPRARCQGLPGD